MPGAGTASGEVQVAQVAAGMVMWTLRGWDWWIFATSSQVFHALSMWESRLLCAAEL